jgi:hypothetical protein
MHGTRLTHVPVRLNPLTFTPVEHTKFEKSDNDLNLFYSSIVRIGGSFQSRKFNAASRCTRTVPKSTTIQHHLIIMCVQITSSSQTRRIVGGLAPEAHTRAKQAVSILTLKADYNGTNSVCICAGDHFGVHALVDFIALLRLDKHQTSM